MIGECVVLVQQRLGMDPTQCMLTDIELAGVIADNHRVMEKPMRLALGYDRYLKSNTTKRRSHSLFRQGCMLYDLIPNMPEVRLLPLMERFSAMLAEFPVFPDTFGVA